LLAKHAFQSTEWYPQIGSVNEKYKTTWKKEGKKKSVMLSVVSVFYQ